MDKTYSDYAASKTVELLGIDSPTGFTAKAAEWVKAQFEALGYTASITEKGGVLIELDGENAADALLLETFTDLAELRLAYEAVRPLGAPVLAYKTFVEDGETLAEGLPEEAACEISSWGADLTGSNCTVGPQRMVEITAQMSAGAGDLLHQKLPQLQTQQLRLLLGELFDVRRRMYRFQNQSESAPFFTDAARS